MNVGKLVGMCKLCFYEYGKILWVCAWIYLWVLANFVGIVENFVEYVRIYLCLKLWEFFLGHVEIFFLHGYGKIWWLYGYVINLVVVTIW